MIKENGEKNLRPKVTKPQKETRNSNRLESSLFTDMSYKKMTEIASKRESKLNFQRKVTNAATPRRYTRYKSKLEANMESMDKGSITTEASTNKDIILNSQSV